MGRIMIVDDSRISRKVLKNLLEGNGHIIVGEAGNGIDALKLYDELNPDLVTMDITMPGMDGIECLEKLREKHPDAKVMMITAAGQKEKMLEAIKLGCVDYVLKPFEEETLRQIVAKHTAP